MNDSTSGITERSRSENSTVFLSAKCCRPPPAVLGCDEFPDIDVWYENCHFRRVLLRIPICIFALISTYLAIALIHDVASNPPAKTTKYGTLLRGSRLFAACFICVVMVYSTLSFVIEENPNANCNWFGKVENGLYWLSISFIYLVLWFRQRAIFKQQNLRHARSRLTSCVSGWTIALVVALPVVNISLFSSSVTFSYDPVLKICVITGYSVKIFVSELVGPILVPTCLVALFALPLIKHQRVVRGSIHTPVKSKASVVGVVRRALILSTFCLLTDIGAILCNSYLPLLGSFVTRQLSVFSNMICMFLCFSDWKRVAIFGCRTPKMDNARSTRTGRTIKVKTMTGGECSADGVSFDSL